MEQWDTAYRKDRTLASSKKCSKNKKQASKKDYPARSCSPFEWPFQHPFTWAAKHWERGEKYNFPVYTSKHVSNPCPTQRRELHFLDQILQRPVQADLLPRGSDSDGWAPPEPWRSKPAPAFSPLARPPQPPSTYIPRLPQPFSLHPSAQAFSWAPGDQGYNNKENRTRLEEEHCKEDGKKRQNRTLWRHEQKTKSKRALLGACYQEKLSPDCQARPSVADFAVTQGWQRCLLCIPISDKGYVQNISKERGMRINHHLERPSPLSKLTRGYLWTWQAAGQTDRQMWGSHEQGRG